MPPFDVERFQRLLRTGVMGQQCLAFEVLASTNTFLYALGRQGEPEGTIVLADEQTAGRGQAEKVWISPPQRNLYVSVLLRPLIAPAQAPLLSLLAAVALVDALRQEGAVCGIKWPNDVLIQQRKVAGILTEMETHQDAVRFVVVGIGVNVNMTEADLEAHLGSVAQPATSLQVSLGRELPGGGVSYPHGEPGSVVYPVHQPRGDGVAGGMGGALAHAWPTHPRQDAWYNLGRHG